MYCVCDYEPANFYQVTTRVARRRFVCDECSGGILPGERYDRAFGVWERSGRVFKTCPRCMALREWILLHVPCFCLAHGNLREDALNAAAEYAHVAPGLLFGAIRREVLIRRRRE